MKKRWLVCVLLLLLSVGLFGCASSGATTVPPAPSDALCGSYIAGATDAQRLFPVDASQAFYYADQKNGRFVRGQVSPRGGDLRDRLPGSPQRGDPPPPGTPL